MSESCPQDIPHWSKVSAASILSASKKYKKRSTCYIFLGLLDDFEKMKVGESELKKYLTKSNETNKDYIRRLWKDIYNQKNSDGDNKYLRYMKSPKPSDSQVEDNLEKSL